MPVLQYTALLLETSSLPKLSASREWFAAALEKHEVGDNTLFQFVWQPRAPSLTLVTIFENAALNGEGFELWAAELGQTLAQELGIRTWELHLTGGTVFDQRIEAFDKNGKRRWRSAFDGTLPRPTAMLEENPFVPRRKAAQARAKALSSRGVGRIEAETKLPLSAFIDVERGQPTDDAQAVMVTVAQDWRKALASWSKKRPSRAAPPEAPVDEKPVARPSELVLLWKHKPAVDAAKLFIHDVARAEKLDPREFGWSVSRVGKSTALRCTFGEKAIALGVSDLLDARITRLGELADVALVVTLAGPEFLTMSAVGYQSQISMGSMEGRSQFTNPHLAHQVKEHGGCSLAALYELATDSEFVGPWLEQPGNEVKLRGTRFTAKHWRALMALKSVAERDRELAKWGPITFEQLAAGLHEASATLRFSPAATQTGTLETKALEASLGRKTVTSLRTSWAKATEERVRRGPMLSVFLS